MPPPVCVRQAAMILETVMKVCPCHRDALFINAQVQYLSGESRLATITLNQLIDIGISGLISYLKFIFVNYEMDNFFG